jgi:stress response protein YsnF
MAEEHDDVAIPLVEERLVTSKHVVETGRVKVRTLVEEQESVVREQLNKAVVDVERVAVNREVDEIPAIREEGDVTIIPVVQEVLVVTKKLVVTEELRIRRRQIVEEHEQPVTLRSQRAVVEREESSGEPVNVSKE